MASIGRIPHYRSVLPVRPAALAAINKSARFRVEIILLGHCYRRIK
jgi:hypothetical protein